MASENVAIIGASAKEERYAYKAQKMLLDHNHKVFPVNPFGGEALGYTFYKDIAEITEKIDTITLYVGPARLNKMIDNLIAVAPRRIIFNPGTESDEAIAKTEAAGIEAVIACTLVLLSTGQF